MSRHQLQEQAVIAGQAVASVRKSLRDALAKKIQEIWGKMKMISHKIYIFFEI